MANQWLNVLKLVFSPAELKPKGPLKELGASFDRIETENVLLSSMKSCVRFCLFMLIASVGGSDVIWKAVFAICTLILSPLLEPII